ncbi:hypothetical protein GOP47_0004135 [Adiantum capillus-veneris]|uniref:DRBM domain-containing protein n=1 Tax=Adiantum capillus-veneris TaxID=13818 RepID=A0A9D4V8Q3_ADICA|nr:hypothetical protein GOP47_0004135 [Adiantum capillus-veneris]
MALSTLLDCLADLAVKLQLEQQILLELVEKLKTVFFQKEGLRPEVHRAAIKVCHQQAAHLLTSKCSRFSSLPAGSFLSCAGMYKNQLQELAQRSCFNLPSYSCIREGPDHAPRFKATVSFNGEVFESPGYHSTLRQAEHAAAEVALNILSRRGPTQSLAARILDETGVCKNLLQETAQRAGVSLPVYTTVRSGPKHQPLFTCMVEVGGRNFVGEPAKTKKQAEKNAALAAWSALKLLTPASHLPLLPACTDSDNKVNVFSGTQYGWDDQVSLQSPSYQGANIQRSKVRSVNVRDRNRIARDGHVSTGQYYPATQLSSAAAVTDSLGYDRYHSAYGPNRTSYPSTGEVSHDVAQQFLYKQSSFTGSAWPQQSANSESLAHLGRTFYNSQATPGPFASFSRRQAGRHQRRHSLSGIESPGLAQEAMAVSHASGGGNMLVRASPHPQQIRGLPYQSLSERFELNRPSLLEELQLKDDEDDWSQRDVMSSSAKQTRHPTGRMRWQSQSERFEYRNHFLPQVEEVQYWDEEEWPQDNSYGINSHVDREQGLETKSGYKEGWLRGDTLLQSLEAQKNHGYREGWLREEIRKHSVNERRNAYRESWADGEVVSYGQEEPSCSSHGSQSQNSIINGERSIGMSGGADLDIERNHSYGDTFKDAQLDNKSAFTATSMASTPSSPFSSLWAKSTQWWGSHRPSSPSSTAAALANTLGLRPASSMAPAVRVRQMVPVCSAPPPRRADPPVSSRHPPVDHSSSLAESEANVNQLFNSLRL